MAKTLESPGHLSTRNSNQKVVEHLADLFVAPYPVLKFVQRAGFALAGKLDDFFDRKAIRSLVKGVEQKDVQAFSHYLDNRALLKCELPKFIRERIVSIVNDAYREELRKEAVKAARRHRSREFETPKNAYPGMLMTRKTVAVDQNSTPHISEKNLSALMPPDYETIGKALEALVSQKIHSHIEPCEFIFDGPPKIKFDFNIDVISHDFKQAFKKAIEIMIKARVLEDYLAQKKCCVSKATFNALLNEFADPIKLLSSAEVQGVIALNQHLRENYPVLSELERAAVLTTYGLKIKPVNYFEKAQRAKADKLLRKKQRYELPDEQVSDSTRSETPAQARNMSQGELAKVVLSQLSPRAREMKLTSPQELSIAAKRIAKCARKTTITMVDLQALIREADDPVQAIVMMVRRPEAESADVSYGEPQKPLEPPILQATQVPSETTYLSDEQRRRLRKIWDRKEASFSEFRSVLLKHFNTRFDSSPGPGSHSVLIRERQGEAPVVAQVSPNVRNGKEKLYVGIIESSLKDLHIDPEDFITALEGFRKLTPKKA
jgi:hypothetical protein